MSNKRKIFYDDPSVSNHEYEDEKQYYQSGQSREIVVVPKRKRRKVYAKPYPKVFYPKPSKKVVYAKQTNNSDFYDNFRHKTARPDFDSEGRRIYVQNKPRVYTTRKYITGPKYTTVIEKTTGPHYTTIVQKTINSSYISNKRMRIVKRKNDQEREYEDNNNSTENKWWRWFT